MKIKKILFVVAVCLSVTLAGVNAASVDYSLTVGAFKNDNVVVSNSGLWQLGVFTGYNDITGAGFFTGKDYATLTSEFTAFASSNTTTDALGQFYTTVDLLATATNTRLFAWGFSTIAHQEASNWIIVSGTIAGISGYDTAWLAVAAADPTVNIIEVGDTHNVVYAKSALSNALTPLATSDGDGGFYTDVNVYSAVPEPSSILLMAGGLAGLALVRRRKA